MKSDLLHIGVRPELVKTYLGEYPVNRDDHRNEDHLEVVQIPLSVLRPFLNIKTVSCRDSDSCRSSSRAHIPAVAVSDGQHKCRKARPGGAPDLNDLRGSHPVTAASSRPHGYPTHHPATHPLGLAPPRDLRGTHLPAAAMTKGVSRAGRSVLVLSIPPEEAGQ
jgi:hypothetical protein